MFSWQNFFKKSTFFKFFCIFGISLMSWFGKWFYFSILLNFKSQTSKNQTLETNISFIITFRIIVNIFLCIFQVLEVFKRSQSASLSSVYFFSSSIFLNLPFPPHPCSCTCQYVLGRPLFEPVRPLLTHFDHYLSPIDPFRPNLTHFDPYLSQLDPFWPLFDPFWSLLTPFDHYLSPLDPFWSLFNPFWPYLTHFDHY